MQTINVWADEIWSPVHCNFFKLLKSEMPGFMVEMHLLKKLPSCFGGGCTILYSPYWLIRLLGPLQRSKHLVPSVFLILADLTSLVTPTVVLSCIKTRWEETKDGEHSSCGYWPYISLLQWSLQSTSYWVLGLLSCKTIFTPPHFWYMVDGYVSGTSDQCGERAFIPFCLISFGTGSPLEPGTNCLG